MFDITGHAINVRGPRQEDAGLLQGIDATPGVVVTGEDLGECVLLIFDQKGKVVFREPSVDGEVSAEYEAGARAMVAALQREQGITDCNCGLTGQYCPAHPERSAEARS